MNIKTFIYLLRIALPLVIAVLAIFANIYKNSNVFLLLITILSISSLIIHVLCNVFFKE